jgi:hypothetical protein
LKPRLGRGFLMSAIDRLRNHFVLPLFAYHVARYRWISSLDR